MLPLLSVGFHRSCKNALKERFSMCKERVSNRRAIRITARFRSNEKNNTLFFVEKKHVSRFVEKNTLSF